MLFFWEFLITRRVGIKRNDNFYFLSFSSFSNLFLAWNEAIMIFFNFFEFFWYFVGIFNYTSGRNGTEWQFLFSLFLIIFQHIWAWNEPIMAFFSFLNCFAIFLEFSISRWVGTKRIDTFYILSFSAFSSLFWLEMNA